MILEVRNGWFGFDRQPILKNVGFSLAQGQILSVLGPNGVGKTTLLRCMMGLLKWQQGRTLIDGRPLEKMAPKDLWKTVAYVPQSKGTNLSYTALEMVVMGRSAHLGVFARPADEDLALARDALDGVGAGYLADKQCSRMSGGELQMVLIARALCVNPRVLVLDEPESNLDFRNQIIILETLSRLAHERGIASVINTHYPAHALQCSDHALLLSRDGSSCYGPVHEVVSEENMRRAFRVHVSIQHVTHQHRRYTGVIPLSAVSAVGGIHD